MPRTLQAGQECGSAQDGATGGPPPHPALRQPPTCKQARSWSTVRPSPPPPLLWLGMGIASSLPSPRSPGQSECGLHAPQRVRVWVARMGQEAKRVTFGPRQAPQAAPPQARPTGRRRSTHLPNTHTRRVASPGSATAGEDEEEDDDDDGRRSSAAESDRDDPYSPKAGEAGEVEEVEVEAELDVDDETEDKQSTWVRVCAALSRSNSTILQPPCTPPPHHFCSPPPPPPTPAPPRPFAAPHLCRCASSAAK